MPDRNWNASGSWGNAQIKKVENSVYFEILAVFLQDMKKLIVCISVLLLGCNSVKKVDLSNNQTLLNCPDDGLCKVEILKNQCISIKNDEFGKLYYELLPCDEKNVVRYIYTRSADEKYKDSGYREEVVFEVNSALSSMSLSDNTLQNMKMLFGRFCFCRGATGYYYIKNGDLKIDNYKGVLDFKIEEVPQIISHIEFDLK
jgi:hypothetical protein